MRLGLVEGDEASERRRAFRDFAEAEIRPYVDEGEQLRTIPDPVRRALASGGYFGRSLPPELGGMGTGLSEYTLQQEELARVWATAAVATTWTNLSGLLLNRFGTEAQRDELLPALARGEKLAAVGFTEPHGGSDASRIRTTATRVDGGWMLRGAKQLIDNAARADFVILTARTNDQDPPHRGLSMFLVLPTDAGFHAGEPYEILGLRPAGVGRFALEDCFVPDDRLVGELDRGFYQMMAMVEFGRTNVAGICVGIAQAAYDLARQFVLARESFGRPLRDSDVIQTRFADMRARVDAARLMAYRAASLFDRGEGSAAESALAKVVASETAVDVTSMAMHLHGGIGLTGECEIERHFRDSRAFVIGEGTSEILRLVIGRHELRQADD